MRPRSLILLVLALALSPAATAHGGFALGPATPQTGVGDNSAAITRGDLDGDGALDLVIANSADPGTVATFRGTGAGGFAKPAGSPFTVGARLHADVELADVTGDGRLDAITANAITGTAAADGRVSVVPGNGAGGLAGGTTLPTGGDRALGVQVAELTGDGILDIAVANRSSAADVQPGSVAVLPGLGAGAFGPATPVSPVATPIALLARDLTCDGRADLVTANDGGTLSVFVQQPGGGFAPAPGSPFPAGASALRGIAAGDVNHDGIPDLAVTSRELIMAATPGRVAVLLGTGSGSFAPAPGSPVSTGGQFARGVELADITGDGRLDLAVTHAQIPGSVGVLAGDGTGGFAPVGGSPFATAFVEQATALAVGAFNGDSLVDVATAHAENAARIVVQLNTGFPAPPAGAAAAAPPCGPAPVAEPPPAPGTAPAAGAPAALPLQPSTQALLRRALGRLASRHRFRAGRLPTALRRVTVDLGGPGRVTITMSARTGPRGKRQTLAAGRALVPAAGRVKVAMTLTKAGRRALARRRTITLRVVLSGRPVGAKTVTAQRTVTLKRR